MEPAECARRLQVEMRLCCGRLHTRKMAFLRRLRGRRNRGPGATPFRLFPCFSRATRDADPLPEPRVSARGGAAWGPFKRLAFQLPSTCPRGAGSLLVSTGRCRGDCRPQRWDSGRGSLVCGWDPSLLRGDLLSCEIPPAPAPPHVGARPAGSAYQSQGGLLGMFFVVTTSVRLVFAWFSRSIVL